MSETIEPLPIPHAALAAEMCKQMDRMIEDALYGGQRPPASDTLGALTLDAIAPKRLYSPIIDWNAPPNS
jgi:hypothetical protein